MSVHVLGNTELMEHIFLQTPLVDVAACYAVNRRWRAIINGSPALQQALFSRNAQIVDIQNFRAVRLLKRTSLASWIFNRVANRHAAKIYLNPLLPKKTPGTSLCDFSEPMDSDRRAAYRRGTQIFVYRNPAGAHIQVWRNAYLTDPPVCRLRIVVYDLYDDSRKLRLFKFVELRAGVLRTGHFFDMLEHLCRTMQRSEIWLRVIVPREWHRVDEVFPLVG